MDFKFTPPPPLLFGESQLPKLKELCQNWGGHLLYVTGGRADNPPEYFSHFCSDLGIDIPKQLLHVQGEPSPDFINNSCRHFRNFPLGGVIAIGGGSVMDAGKAISAMLPLNSMVEDYLEGVGKGLSHPGGKLPFVAIPTTAGTGGEATKNAVLGTVGEKGFKKSIRHDNFVPDCAVIIPKYSTSCPPQVTAACGLDAFTQLLESYVSPLASPITDALAVQGLEYIIHNLERVYYNHPEDEKARGKLALAAFNSGVCLANAGLGSVHGMASPLGGYFPIPHGVACGTMLAVSTDFNLKKIKKENNQAALSKYAKVGGLFNHGSRYKPTLEYQCDTLVENLYRWQEDFKIQSLREYGISRSDIPKIARGSLSRNNPVKLDVKDFEDLLESRW